MFGKKMSIVVEMIPTEGETVRKEVEVSSSATVEDALKAAGIDPKNKNFEVDRKVAKLDSKIADLHSKPVVTAIDKSEPRRKSPPPKPHISASERVAGS
ncbi:hypothetical protein IT407_05195 [Candidatus Uhrbacteria bacterium]|nr:hypothetical protein [Candidatus Uhrbacteria bacterium]